MTSMGRIDTTADRRVAPRADLAARTASGEVRVSVRNAAEAIDDLAPEWVALAESASEPNPFAEHWFAAASLRTLAEGRHVRLLEVRRSDRLIGLLPVAPHRGYARLPVTIVQTWMHDQMFLGAPLVAAGEELAFWSAILEALDEADRAASLFHIRGLVEHGPLHRALIEARGGLTVHRRVRALLESELSPEAYYKQAVRQKKRKEIRRLRKRLAERGPVETRILADAAELDAWCATYLALEKAGWKGEAGSALASHLETEAFFRAVVAAAWAAGRLQFLRLDAGGTCIAMLVNFLTPPGSFSFKTVFDESHARFSPGVLIQLENLRILDDPRIAWMDSCASEDHPMIDSLWTERRTIVRVSVPLKGLKRRALYAVCTGLERLSAAVKGRKLAA
ncbi:GNAT family N-acetyltransferase [Allosphingosinicella sp.]|uniref:GNAT family N-acetyltransferase n=1 Tax=Allosphingosinicella sp. TaxID=2823234 RepID=UPI0037842820